MAVWNETSLAKIGRYTTLSADYYAPEFERANAILEQAISKVVPLKRLVELRFPITYGVLKPREVEAGTFRLARIQNSEGLFIFGSDLPTISSAQFDEYARSEVRLGDIVIAIGGYIGPLGVISDAEGSRININRHLARISADSELIDPYFLAAYLSCSISQTLLRREIRGAVQAGINLADLKLHPVFVPSEKDQKTIADQMRRAENLLLRSRTAYSDAQHLLESELGLDKLSFQKPVGYTARFSELEESHRSDAQHYQPRFAQLFSHLAAFSPKRIRDIRTFNRRGLQPIYVENGPIDVVNSQHLGPQHTDYDGLQKTSEKSFAASTEGHIQNNDLLIYTTGAYIGRTNVYLRNAPALASNHVNILRLNPGIDSAYMALVFQSVVGKFQTQKHARGSAQAELYPADIDRFIVPLLGPTKQIAIGDLARKSLEKRQESKRLLDQAKTRVEQFIEEAVRS